MTDDIELTRAAMAAFKKRLTRQAVASLQVCVHCGQCADACHYYLASDGDPTKSPVYKMDRVRKVYKRTVDWLGRVAPGWVGAQDLDAELLAEWVQMAYGACTMCRRCMINCPMGVDPAQVLGLARGVLTEVGMTPKGLQATINVHLESGNNMGVTREDYIDTLQWMEEELQGEVEDASARIPLDKAGARVMYTFNPREVKYYPYLIQAAAKIFNAAGEDWTVSTTGWDATNYALFAFDPAAGAKLAALVEEAATRLGVKQLVMAECGHGFRSQRWEGENWLGHTYPFEVVSFVELQAQYLREGRIQLDPSRNAKRVTYHDPCNQARSGGLVAEPRAILRRAVTDFVEMTPHGVDNFCCGGGGGMLAMSEFARERMAAAKIKAEQIQATGAEVVATSCHNCLDQLGEINRHYKLGVKVHNLSELVANAIIWEKRTI